MTTIHKALYCVSISLAFALAACKPKTEAPPAADAAAAAVQPAAPVAAAAPPPVPAPAAAGPANTAGNASLDQIAVISKPLPPFPYIDYPAAVGEAFQSTSASDFDQLHLIVGDKLHTVEGKFKLTAFDLDDAKISEFQARRDYTKAALDLGGVKVNTVQPANEAFVAANGGDSYQLDKKLKHASHHSYDAYLLKTAAGNSWLVLMISDSKVRILAIEEKAAASSVKLVTAAAMKSALDTDGRIALYINFDTDKSNIRADGKPAVDEITALMKGDSALRLAVEGHTDNQGDARRNTELSRARAEAVVSALVADGIDKKRLSAAGHGAAKPIADNGDEAGRAKNRRVELVKLVAG